MVATPFLAAPACAADSPVVTVTRVIDGNTVMLDGAPAPVLLYGIIAPHPEKAAGSRAEPLAAEAKTYLEGLVKDQTLTVQPAPNPTDRLGHTQAELMLPNGESLQAAMVKAGMARVYTTVDNPAIARTLYPLEQKARAVKTGLWALDAYTVLTPESATKHMNQFQLVEGTVQDVAEVSGTTYLNFGDDWRTDFTAAMPNTLAKSIGAAGFKGTTRRVRGWVFSKNGPMISITHAEQIELSEPANAPQPD